MSPSGDSSHGTGRLIRAQNTSTANASEGTRRKAEHAVKARPSHADKNIDDHVSQVRLVFEYSLIGTGSAGYPFLTVVPLLEATRRRKATMWWTIESSRVHESTCIALRRVASMICVKLSDEMSFTI